MHLKALDLVNFRSYERQVLFLHPGITVFVGPNGQGKTNLVEAVWYAASLGSHRVSNDAALVRRGADVAVIRLLLARSGRDLRLEIRINPGRANEVRVHNHTLPRARDVLGRVRAVMFSPEDLALIKGEPEGRRRFLDEILFEIAPRYAGIKAEFEKVLRQRNHLLKQIRQVNRGVRRSASHRGGADTQHGQDPRESARATLDVWDEQLAKTGAELIRARLHLVNRLRPHVGYSYARVASDEGSEPAVSLRPDARGEVLSPANIRYSSSVLEGRLAPAAEATSPSSEPPLPTIQALHDELLAQVTHRHEEDIERGLTSVGPHRDDLEIRLHDFPARGYASHGESWSLALALRLGAYDLLTIEEGDEGDGEPLLILDDVLSELDVHRRDRLARVIQGAQQVLITTANDTDIPESLARTASVIDVVKGAATPRGNSDEPARTHS